MLPYEASPDNLVNSGVKVEEAIGILATSPAKEVVAIVDSCFSGTGERSVLPKDVRALTRVRELAPSSRVVLLTASRADETSGAAPGESVGLFSKYVSEGLGRGLADGDGQISAGELKAWVAPRVEREAAKLHRSQHPQLSGGTSTGPGDPAAVVLGYGYR